MRPCPQLIQYTAIEAPYCLANKLRIFCPSLKSLILITGIAKPLYDREVE